MACIYEIKNKINGKVYIGSTVNFKKRKYTHKYNLNNDIHINPYLQNAWNKYGEENFDFNILQDNIKPKDKYEVEQKYLKEINPFGDNGYNINKKANGFESGYNHPKSKLNESQVFFIKKLLSEGKNARQTCSLTGISIDLIYQIFNLNNYKDIGEEFNDVIVHIRNKRKEVNENEIINMHLNGIDANFISEKLNVGTRNVKEIIKLYDAEVAGKIIYCIVCGKKCIKKSNRQKYCKPCSKKKYNK